MRPFYPFLWLALAALLVAGCSGGAKVRKATGPAQLRGLGSVTAGRIGSIELLQQRSHRERTVAVRLVFIGGSRLIPRTMEGLEGLTLEAVLKGSSADASAADIRQRLADLGARVTAEPGVDYSAVSLHCLERHFPAAWALLMGQIMSPAFVADEFEPIRAAYLERLVQLESSAQVRALRRAREAMLYQHPYVASPEGTPATVASILLDSVQTHYARMLRTERLRIVTAGGLDPERLQQELSATLLALPTPAQVPPAIGAPPVIQFTDRPQFVDDAGAESEGTAHAIGLLHGPTPATRAGLAFELALVALARRLEADLCERRSLTCDLRVLHQPELRPYVAIVLAGPRPAPTIRAAVSLLAALQVEGFAADEIETARAQLLTATYDGLQDSDGRARALARAWMQGQGMPAATGDWQLAAKAPELWQRISADEVNAALKNALAEIAWCYVGETKNIGFGVFGGR